MPDDFPDGSAVSEIPVTQAPCEPTNPWGSEQLPDGSFRNDFTDLDLEVETAEHDPQEAVRADLDRGPVDSGLPPGERPSSPFSQNGKPIWILPSGALGFEEGSAPFFIELAKRQELFIQGEKIVEVRKRTGEIAPVNPSGLRARLELVDGPLHEYRKRGDGYVIARGRCSEEVAKGMYNSRARENLSLLRVVSRCPILVENDNGDLEIRSRGYWPIRGGVYVLKTKPPPDVPLAEAMRAIVRAFEDFKFLTDADLFRALAYPIVIAISMGGLLDAQIPINFVDALEGGTGKSYFSEVTTAFFGDTPYLATPRKGLGSIDESLSEGMVRGRPFIRIGNLDNLQGEFDSRFLEEILTSESANARVMYTREVAVDPRNHFFFINSNSLPDKGWPILPATMQRRCWPIRIRKRPLNFVWNQYREGKGDILAHIRANQRYYLGCLFSVIREWHRAGKPRTDERRHSFEACSQVADWIMQNVFKTSCPLFSDYDKDGQLITAIEPPRGDYQAPTDYEDFFAADSPIQY